MSYKSIHPKVLKLIVAGAPVLLTTKDISEDPRVRRAYLELVGRRNYHAFVGPEAPRNAH